MDNEYALVRGQSKKEIKNEQTKNLYKDITSALHEKVGEFMAEVTVSEDGDSEVFREDVENNIRELKRNQTDEVHERISGDRQLMEQYEKLNVAMSRGHNDLKYLLEQESRERMSLQKQIERDLAKISEALVVSQRMQPRGFDDLREMMMRLEENCKENSKRMDVSIREDVRRMLQEDARTCSFYDQRLNDLHRSVKELEQLQRMQPRGFDELREMTMRLEENCKENCKRMDVSIRDDVRRMLQEDARTRSFPDQRLDDLHRSVKELEQGLERIVGDVRSAVQEQATKTRAPTKTSRPGEMARGWQREERQFVPAVAPSPTSFREMSPQQMSPQQTTSPQAPPRGMSRGWSREEVRRPIYAGGL